MQRRRLKYYFGYFPRWTIVLIALGILLALLTMWVAPGGNFRDGFRSRLHATFADQLGVEKRYVEGYSRFAIIMCIGPLPLLLVFLGGSGLQRYFRERPRKDVDADLLIGQYLAGLPYRVVDQLGLPRDLMRYDILTLWGPHPDDLRLVVNAYGNQRRPASSDRSKIMPGDDGRARFARYDVLVLLREGGMIYLLDGFFNLMTGKFSGERWGEYRASDIMHILEDESHARLALRFHDGWQYEINLVNRQEAEKVFNPFQTPLYPYESAVTAVKDFCSLVPTMQRVRMMLFGTFLQFTQEDKQAVRRILAKQSAADENAIEVLSVLPGSNYLSIKFPSLQEIRTLFLHIDELVKELKDLIRIEVSSQPPQLKLQHEEVGKNATDEEIEMIYWREQLAQHQFNLLLINKRPEFSDPHAKLDELEKQRKYELARIDEIEEKLEKFNIA